MIKPKWLPAKKFAGSSAKIWWIGSPKPSGLKSITFSPPLTVFAQTILTLLFRFLLPLLLVLSVCTGVRATLPSTEALADRVMELSDSVVKARLALLDQDLLDPRLDKDVRRRIINYLEQWPTNSGRLISRSARYFPLFEEQLRSAGMPTQLKYMAAHESALRPFATSHAGAGGLWQLMPGTARELGLTVNDELDERLDVELATEAGLRYLRYQYERYENWGLAIAAYNCGPGNVNRAIRRSGRKNPTYYQIQKHLPRETRRYIPNIIAAAYLLAFYQHYETVEVGPMPLDLQLTEAVTVHRFLSLHRVAQVTGLHPDVVVELNPQYLRGYLPGLPGGHRLRLPQRVMPAMLAWLNAHAGKAEENLHAPPWATALCDDAELDTDHYYDQFQTFAYAEDTLLQQIADRYQLSADQLSVWSRTGLYDSLRQDQPLTFYRIREYRPLDPRVRDVPPPVPVLANQPPSPVTIPRRTVTPRAPTPAAPAVARKATFADRLRSWFE